MSDLEFYPGSKRRIEEPIRCSTPDDDVVAWDHRPVIKWLNNKQVEMFTIGAVCAALGRPPVTIRLWIRQGHLPQAPYKMPDKNGIKGRRLYGRPHIEALIEVAKKHRILDCPRVEWDKHPTFAAEVSEVWSTLTLT